MTDTLNLYYARIANMGDLLNPLIIERCFGYRVERCSFLTGDLCAIGSGLARGSSTTMMHRGGFSSAICAFMPCAAS